MNYFTDFLLIFPLLYYLLSIIVKNNCRIFLKKYLIFYEYCDIIDKC